MRLLAARTLFVLACLSVPQFIQGGRIVFLPAVNLWKWGNQAVNGHGGLNFTVNNPDFLWNVLLLFVIPVAFALWFQITDCLRTDIHSIQKRSRYLLNLIIPAASWLLMVLAITYSIDCGGPISANRWLYNDVQQYIYGTAFALLTVEYLTFWIAHSKR